MMISKFCEIEKKKFEKQKLGGKTFLKNSNIFFFFLHFLIINSFFSSVLLDDEPSDLTSLRVQ
jgi:hypothetical protein